MKALLLLSGGIDSPVAGAMLKRQGVELEALHLSFEPITDDASVVKARELAALLDIPLHVQAMGDDLALIPHDYDAHKHYFVLQKRLFYRFATRVAKQIGATAIVTGENLGQVSSQTLQNLSVLEEASELPVLRPLLGLDKNDIIRLAKQWGSYETSLGPELCDILGPDKPATSANLAKVLELEAKMNFSISS